MEQSGRSGLWKTGTSKRVKVICVGGKQAGEYKELVYKRDILGWIV